MGTPRSFADLQISFCKKNLGPTRKTMRTDEAEIGYHSGRRIEDMAPTLVHQYGSAGSIISTPDGRTI